MENENSKQKETDSFTEALVTGKMVEGVKDVDSLKAILENSQPVVEDEEVLPIYTKNATHPGELESVLQGKRSL